MVETKSAEEVNAACFSSWITCVFQRETSRRGKAKAKEEEALQACKLGKVAITSHNEERVRGIKRKRVSRAIGCRI